VISALLPSVGLGHPATSTANAVSRNRLRGTGLSPHRRLCDLLFLFSSAYLPKGILYAYTVFLEKDNLPGDFRGLAIDF
jgi:hypothetical protein